MSCYLSVVAPTKNSRYQLYLALSPQSEKEPSQSPCDRRIVVKLLVWTPSMGHLLL